MKNEKRIPFETIEKVVEGEPEAIHNVVCYYSGEVAPGDLCKESPPPPAAGSHEEKTGLVC